MSSLYGTYWGKWQFTELFAHFVVTIQIRLTRTKETTFSLTRRIKKGRKSQKIKLFLKKVEYLHSLSRHLGV